MIVCLCRAVSDTEVGHAIAEGARSVREIARRCRAGTGCGTCVPMIAEMIEDAKNGCGDCPRACSSRPSPYLPDEQETEQAA